MSDPFLGEIRAFGFNFAPRGWAKCEQQLLPISQYTALFSLLGTIYGGDGRTTFGLPDLRGRSPMGAGNGPGLTSRNQGAKGGVENFTLSSNQMPAHTHVATLYGKLALGTKPRPSGNLLAVSSPDRNYVPATETGAIAAMDPASVQTAIAGGSQPVFAQSPYQVVNFCIALQGLYPSRS